MMLYGNFKAIKRSDLVTPQELGLSLPTVYYMAVYICPPSPQTPSAMIRSSCNFYNYTAL